MKKAVSIILAAALALSMTACSSGSSSSTTSTTAAQAASAETSADGSEAAAESGEKTTYTGRLAKIMEKGVLEVCTEPYFAPNEFIDSSKQGDEQYQGMDIEIAKYIADKLGVELKIVPLEFSAVLAGIADGKYDLAISALAYSPARAEAMRMSKGYFFSDDGGGYGFAVRPEDKDKYTSLDDLADAVVVVQSGSVQEALLDQSGCKVKEKKLVSSMTDAYLAVTENKADVAVCYTTSAELYGEANGDNIVVTDFLFEVSDEMSGTRIAACLDDTESLIEFVNTCIDELTESGQIMEWHDYYTEYAKTLGIE